MKPGLVNPFVVAAQKNLESEVLQAEDPVLEMTLSVCILAIVIGIAIATYFPLIVKSRMVSMWFWVGLAREEIALYHAETGRWPNYEDLMFKESTLASPQDLGIKSVQIRDGSFNLVLEADSLEEPGKLEQWNLSFRRYRNNPNTPINWVCGHAQPLPGHAIEAPPNLTDLDDRLSVSTCRN